MINSQSELLHCTNVPVKANKIYNHKTKKDNHNSIISKKKSKYLLQKLYIHVVHIKLPIIRNLMDAFINNNMCSIQ